MDAGYYFSNTQRAKDCIPREVGAYCKRLNWANFKMQFLRQLNLKLKKLDNLTTINYENWNFEVNCIY